MVMRQKRDLSAIIRQVKEKGYFDFADFPGVILNLEELKKLSQLLEKDGIPLGAEVTSDNNELSQREALQIVNSLRKGVPPPTDVTTFSVGRGNLLDKFRKDIRSVESGSSQVRFMNADWGAGKTHSLYLLRENAFRCGFVVSIVTLSQSSCPLYDFMTVYHQIMWNLRTREERTRPALENVLDRWLKEIKEIGEERGAHIIGMLPENLVCALQAYHESVSPVRRDEDKRLLVLRHLSGERLYLRDLHNIGIECRIESSNALGMLGQMALLFKNLKYSGICILFDEAETIHSFSRAVNRDAAYNNIFQITKQSKKTPFCYFLYATTPSFFDNYAPYWPATRISSTDIIELERLEAAELEKLALIICDIYAVAKVIKVPQQTHRMLLQLTQDPSFSDTIGNFVRRCVGILDEMK
jgi:hypothetical protein